MKTFLGNLSFWKPDSNNDMRIQLPWKEVKSPIETTTLLVIELSGNFEGWITGNYGKEPVDIEPLHLKRNKQEAELG